jgi:hypothetical protein
MVDRAAHTSLLSANSGHTVGSLTPEASATVRPKNGSIELFAPSQAEAAALMNVGQTGKARCRAGVGPVGQTFAERDVISHPLLYPGLDPIKAMPGGKGRRLGSRRQTS